MGYQRGVESRCTLSCSASRIQLLERRAASGRRWPSEEAGPIREHGCQSLFSVFSLKVFSILSKFFSILSIVFSLFSLFSGRMRGRPQLESTVVSHYSLYRLDVLSSQTGVVEQISTTGRRCCSRLLTFCEELRRGAASQGELIYRARPPMIDLAISNAS